MPQRHTITQAAAVLRISRQRLYVLARSGRIEVKRESLSGMQYVTDAELRRYRAAPPLAAGRPRKITA